MMGVNTPRILETGRKQEKKKIFSQEENRDNGEENKPRHSSSVTSAFLLFRIFLCLTLYRLFLLYFVSISSCWASSPIMGYSCANPFSHEVTSLNSGQQKHVDPHQPRTGTKVTCGHGGA
jgi:hypothetical protein